MTNTINATPIIRAADVTAVRPGLRTAFSVASFPTAPKAARIGAPRVRPSGRANAADNTARPMKRNAAPAPTNTTREMFPGGSMKRPRAIDAPPSAETADPLPIAIL